MAANWTTSGSWVVAGKRKIAMIFSISAVKLPPTNATKYDIISNMNRINRVFSSGDYSFFLFGPRGTGKSTWLNANLKDAFVIDLLDSGLRLKLQAKPERLKDIVLSHAEKRTIVIDEIQKIPALLDVVHSLMESGDNHRYVLTGSSARKLKRTGVDLLGGRALELHMHPFMACELGNKFSLDEALETGLIPVVGKYADRNRALGAYLGLYIREEVEQEGLVRNLDAFARFLEVMSFAHGGVLAPSEIARECSIKRSTVDGYISILDDLLIGFRLPVFTKRAKRRLVAREKFYYFDAGVFRKLRPLGKLDQPSEIAGQALEGLVCQHLRAWCDYSGLENSLFYWRTADGHEIDFVVYTSDDFTAIEVKHSDRITSEDLAALKLFARDYPEARRVLLYRGEQRYLEDGILITPVDEYLKALTPNNPLPENQWIS